LILMKRMCGVSKNSAFATRRSTNNALSNISHGRDFA